MKIKDEDRPILFIVGALALVGVCTVVSNFRDGDKPAASIAVAPSPTTPAVVAPKPAVAPEQAEKGPSLEDQMALAAMKVFITKAKLAPAIITGASLNEDFPSVLDVQLTMAFESQQRNVRRTFAQSLQQQWARSHGKASQANTWCLHLYNQAGHRIGGSGWSGCSSVDVDD